VIKHAGYEFKELLNMAKETQVLKDRQEKLLSMLENGRTEKALECLYESKGEI
jgi:hypothetical protein